MAKVKKKKFSKKAAGLKGMWKTAKKQMEEEGDIFGAEVEDGAYIAKLVGAEVKESAASWNYVDWQFEILEGESEGASVSRRSGIETEENLVWLMRDFTRFGLDPDDIDLENNDDLTAILNQIVEAEPKCRIVAKTNDANIQNVYINKVIEIEETPDDNGKDGDAGFEEGDRVSVDIDGTDYEGDITSVADDKAEVSFDDGDKGTYDLDELTKLDEATSAEIEKGDRVTVDIDGTDYPGTVKKIKGDQVTITCDDGDTVTADASDVTKLEEAGDWLGKQAGFKKGKKMLVGKIIKVNEDKQTFAMKTDTGKTVTGDIDDLEEVEAGLEKGDRVSAEIDDETYEGVIKSVDDDEANVLFDDGDRRDMPLDGLTKLEEAGGDEAGGDQGELNVGDNVEVDYKDKAWKGIVKKINEKDEEVTVFIRKTKKKITVPVDAITIID